MSSTEASASDACPSEDEVVALFCGQLAPEAVSRVLAHADDCSMCALVVAEAGFSFAQQEGQLAHLRSPRAVFAPGQIVASRYRIERRIGYGGMGEVYSAVDQEFCDRVALKTICPAFASEPSSVDRFKLELRLARRISHPSVCRVFEFGRHELSPGESQCFFTLDFIEGVTLRQRLLDAGRLDVPSAVKLARELASGLAAIHDQNVVHRDIKPENVMLPSQPSGATAIWVDFGLARVDLRESRSPAILAGTPDYAAPELARGTVASRSSDVYSFGVMLYELLTGALPFAFCASFRAATERNAAKLRAPSALRPEIPAELDALVLACLQEVPERRPPSAAHVAARLGEIATAYALAATPAAPAARDGSLRPTTSRATAHWSIIVSLTIAAAAACLALHSAIPTESVPVASVVSETTLAPSVSQAVPAPDTESIAAELNPAPERKALRKRPVAAATTASSPAALPTASALRPLPDFGGRR